ncbi:MAG: HAD hydrolase-like protein [bacterium]
MEKYFIFDFDGVIVDSFALSLEIVRKFNPTMGADEYRAMYTGNIYDSIKVQRVKQPIEFDFFKFYAAEINSLAPIPGMSELLKKISPQGISIVTSSITKIVQDYLINYKLYSYFDEILGCDLEKSKILKLTMLQKKYPDKRLIFITDTLGDVLEANKLHLDTIAVTWGVHEREVLTQGKTLAIVDTLNELGKLLLSK